MKNIILYSVLVVFVSVFIACDDDDDTNFLPSNEIGVDVSKVTIFDSPFTVNLTTSNTNVDEIVISGGVIEGRAVSISDMKGSTTMNDTDFGANWAIGKKTSFSTTVDFGSSNSVGGFSISVAEALAAELSAASIAEYDSAMSEVKLTGATKFNALGNIVVERKVITEADPDPDFVEVESKTADKEYEFTNELYGVDFNLTDTVVYKITATSGSYSESTMIELPVVSKTLPGMMDGMLDATDSELALMPVEDGDDVGVLEFVSPRSISSDDVMFVQIEEGNQVELFAELNVFSTLVEIVDGSTLVGTIDDAAINEVYAFMYYFEDVSYYGYLKITEIHSTDIGDAKNAIELTYTQSVNETNGL
jgi:hypothetical protein